MRHLASSIVALVVIGLFTLPAAAANNTTRFALDRRTIDATLTNVTLNDSIDYLRDVSGANVHVNWRALESMNITKETLVNIKLRQVTVRKVLDLILSEAGEGNLLTYYIEDNVLEITTRKLADEKLYTKVYPVEDLVTEVPDFAGPDFNLQSNTQISGGGSGGSGGGSGSGGSSQGLFGGSNGGNSGGGRAGENGQQTKSRAQMGDDLVKLIMDIVQPEVWRDNGGTATIKYFQGKLIITAPRSVHEAIGGPLD